MVKKSNIFRIFISYKNSKNIRFFNYLRTLKFISSIIYSQISEIFWVLPFFDALCKMALLFFEITTPISFFLWGNSCLNPVQLCLGILWYRFAYVDQWFRLEKLPTHITWIMLSNSNVDYEEVKLLAEQIAPEIAAEDERSFSTQSNSRTNTLRNFRQWNFRKEMDEDFQRKRIASNRKSVV